MKKILQFIAMLPLILSCSDSSSDTTDYSNTNANNTGAYASRLEIPALDERDIFITHTTSIDGKENITYSLSFNAQRKHSRWNAFTFDNSNRKDKWARKNWEKYANTNEWVAKELEASRGSCSDPYRPDPEIPESYMPTREQIIGSGYVRGHIIASADRLHSQEANAQTFYYSNISPMLSKFNTGVWQQLENQVKSWGHNSAFCDTLYVVKGGTIEEGYYTSDYERTTIPTHYFMALLSVKKGIYSCVGFWFEHKSNNEKDYWKYAVTIDELETNTGIDFFCNLTDKIEKNIERVYDKSQWRD